jgi:hypothetical protein
MVSYQAGNQKKQTPTRSKVDMAQDFSCNGLLGNPEIETNLTDPPSFCFEASPGLGEKGSCVGPPFSSL